MDYSHIIYHSKTKAVLTEEELSKILLTARRENLKNGVTGFLIYRDNHFLQLLEGGEDAVKETLDRISKDPRHYSVTVIGEYKSINRIMPEWSMAHIDSKKIGTSASSLIDLFDLARGNNIFNSEKSFEVVLKKFSEEAEYL